MKLKTFLLTAISMTLPASMLCAQDNAPQPPQPPNAPQGLPPARDGGPQRPEGDRQRPEGDRQRPEGDRQRPEGQPRPDGQRGPGQGDGRRMGPSLFNLLDANHDGVIDEQEMKNAPDVLKKLDRRGDGRITPDEFFPQFDGRFQRRPQDGNAQQPGQPLARPDQPGQPRGEGDRDRQMRPEGRGDFRPDQQRGEGRGEGDRQMRPPGRDDFRPDQPRGDRRDDGRGEGNRRPQFDRDGQRPPGGNDGRDARPQGPGPQPGGPGAAPQGPQGRDGGPQAWMQRRPQSEQEMRQRFEHEMRERFARDMQRRQEMMQRFERGRQQWQAQNNGPQQPGQPGPQWNQPRPGPGPQNQGPQAGPGERPPGPMGPQPGQQFAQNGPRWPGMEHRHHHHRFGPQQGGQGFAQNRPQFGPQGPWMGHRHHHRGPFGPDQGRGFAQNRPQFGPQGPWMQRGPGFQRGPQGPYAMGPRMDGRRPGWPGRGPQDFRNFSRRPQPQDGQREFRPAPQRGPGPGGEFPRPDVRRFDGRGMNPPGPGGPQQDNRGPGGNPPQHHHFHPGVTDNLTPEEGGAAGPQGEPAPEFQPSSPAPNDYGNAAPPAAPGDVI